MALFVFVGFPFFSCAKRTDMISSPCLLFTAVGFVAVAAALSKILSWRLLPSTYNLTIVIYKFPLKSCYFWYHKIGNYRRFSIYNSALHHPNRPVLPLNCVCIFSSLFADCNVHPGFLCRESCWPRCFAWPLFWISWKILFRINSVKLKKCMQILTFLESH